MIWVVIGVGAFMTVWLVWAIWGIIRDPLPFLDASDEDSDVAGATVTATSVVTMIHQ